MQGRASKAPKKELVIESPQQYKSLAGTEAEGEATPQVAVSSQRSSTVKLLHRVVSLSLAVSVSLSVSLFCVSLSLALFVSLSLFLSVCLSLSASLFCVLHLGL